MGKLLDNILDTVDGIAAWLGTALGQANETYCELETADGRHNLVTKDGSLVSVIRVMGATYLVGPDEFQRLHKGLTQNLQTCLGRPGHAIQVLFIHDKEAVGKELKQMLQGAEQTSKRLELDLDDLLRERSSELSRYCAYEAIYFVIYSRISSLNPTQLQLASEDRQERYKNAKLQPLRNAQNFLHGLPELREGHNSLLRTITESLNNLGLLCYTLDVHAACKAIRETVDGDYTNSQWRPYLPGDTIPIRETENYKGELSDVLWPSLSQQLIPRDGENINLRIARLGDKIYAPQFIELFPKELQSFGQLFNRCLAANIPWRISFLIESGGLQSLGLKSILASILSFAHEHNKLINSSLELLRYLEVNSDEAIVKLRVSTCTWAPLGEEKLLRMRSAELAKAVQGWGYCETSEVSGDAYLSVLASSLAISTDSPAPAAIAPLSDVCYMLPFNRPASPWNQGGVLFRSVDGKPWPYQPGSSMQTTWIDLIYARPGSGKSVLSNAINLALCLSSGLTRLPYISIIDIGPSSSGLISLIQEALPAQKKHLASYHRLRMRKEMAINPFDTQLGNRYPSPLDRAFLVNFLTLLATPIGQESTYDGISDMAGLIIDELYKGLADDGNPHPYTPGINNQVDAALKNTTLVADTHTTWWEVTDALFKADLIHEATLAQRYAMPILADAAAICRTTTIEDLFGAIKTPTGEPIINAFSRMISSAIREYPILSQITAFDLGQARVVSLDLDEVAKTGGDAADRQTAIMYMLSRYVLARHFYLNEDLIKDIPDLYKEYHKKRILEIREDPKRLVMDEFHRTTKAKAVREQVLVDMREGRKWKVQVALLSQSLDDFDPTMIEFATSIFIMDAGPKQALEKSVAVFGLSPTAKLALETRVHGPRAGGATFLAQFATKYGSNTQLLTSTIGPMELWAFNTSADDARIRNALYEKMNAKTTRRVLAMLYPTGSASKTIEERMHMLKEKGELITDDKIQSVIDTIIEEIYRTHKGAFI